MSTLLPVTATPILSLTKTLPLPNRNPYLLSFKFNSIVSHCSISDHEEHRWLREEQRWIREEQRWLREEQRWARERDHLLREISDLKLQIQALERRLLTRDFSSPASVSDAVANVTLLLQVLKDKNLVLESGSSLRNTGEEEEKQFEEVVEREKEVLVVEESVRVEKRSALRKGSEGEEVRHMQEALLKLGFYSGEEDMEYSSFSSGTERAVKTWQAALGAAEDGIMTAELLEKLYSEIRNKDTGSATQDKQSTTVLPKEGENGAAVASVTEISEVQQKVVKNDKETEVSHRGVFLLGENRWENPSRLVASEEINRSKNKDATTKCLQCRGEGRLLCTDPYQLLQMSGSLETSQKASGQPARVGARAMEHDSMLGSNCKNAMDLASQILNLSYIPLLQKLLNSPVNSLMQFLEWVDEGAKCPYCDGHGYIVCDLCGGKTM
ncbi:Protein disulfide isomerase pTAC5, chloroplastic, partial [Mucuna pruriens]